MLNTAIAAAYAVRNNYEFDPWGTIGVEAVPVIADLKSCWQKVVLRRRAVKDTWERLFGTKIVASSAVGETLPHTTVRLSDFVEVGDVQYVEEHNNLGLPCCS